MAVRAVGQVQPQPTTAVSMLARLLHHCHVVITDETPPVLA